MKFFDDLLCQKNKKHHDVCGDYCLYERTSAGMIYVLCDGVGSGIYANISAITCANRILELIKGGMSIRMTCEMVAASMHRARKEDIPFAAFSAALISYDGKYAIYSYESPNPILMKNNHATILNPRFYTTGFEVIGESTGVLNLGDSLIMFSDGVSQAGLGHGHGMGIGSDGVCSYINLNFKPGDIISNLPYRIVEMCKKVSGGQCEDDTTLAMLNCREAKELTLLTGPPSKRTMNHDYALNFKNMPGKKIICGSTTTDIIAEELGLKVETISMGKSFGQLPEYKIDGIDLVTEGAITLNQVNNILDEPMERLSDDTIAERLCLMLHAADVINLMIGNASNDAHDDLIFKQTGVQIRRHVIKKISERLKNMGKLVIEHNY
jgi:hypothetical protein